MQTFQRNDIDKAIHDAVQQLNCDMEHMKTRISSLERLTGNLKSSEDSKTFLGELSPSTTAFFVVWPFIAFAILKMCNKP